MSFIKRYSNILKGGIQLTGNTLGLSKLADQNKAGTLGSIGAFTSLDTTLKVNDFPNGTTLDYTKNGSMNKLSLPVGSTVLYAELIWGGLYKSTKTDLSAIINNNITFITPFQEVSITPDNLTKQNLSIALSTGTIYAYVRSANVTQYVTNGMNGDYVVKKVPGLIEKIDNYTNVTNHAGWTLAVIYGNDSMSIQSINLWVGGAVVHPNSGVTDVTISGFVTPETEFPNGKLFVSSAEGDANIVGDYLRFGVDAFSLAALSGPNNPLGNFFCSQINDSDGHLNSYGTFGTRNANAFTGENTSAVRQGWDITAIDLTSILKSQQNSAVVRFTSNGDMYLPNCLAIQIDNNGYPDLNAIKSSSQKFAVKGDIITYKITLTNTGTYNIVDQIFKDIIEAGSQFVAASVTVGGTNYPSYDPEIGFTLPPLAPNASIVVTFQVEII